MRMKIQLVIEMENSTTVLREGYQKISPRQQEESRPRDQPQFLSDIRILSIDKQLIEGLTEYETLQKDREQTTNPNLSKQPNNIYKRLLLQNKFLHKLGAISYSSKKQENKNNEPTRRYDLFLQNLMYCLSQVTTRTVVNMLSLFCPALARNPYRVLEQYETAVVCRYKKYNRVVEGGSTIFVNPRAETLEVFDCRAKLMRFCDLLAFTKDFIKLKIDASVSYRTDQPLSAKLKYVDSQGYLDEVCKYHIKLQMSRYQLDQLMARLPELTFEIEQEINSELKRSGLRVQTLMVKQVALMDSMEEYMSLSKVAEQMGQSRLIQAQSQVQISTMKQDMSQASTQRHLIENKQLKVLKSLCSTQEVVFFY